MLETSAMAFDASRLICEATCACVHVRLRQTQPLRASLQAMLRDAMHLTIGGDQAQDVLRLRRVIRLALAAAIEDSAV